MLQIKKFKLLEEGVDEQINEWLRSNYHLVEMKSDGKGSAISVYGNVEPVMIIQYSNVSRDGADFHRQGLAEQIKLKRHSLFELVQQLEYHRSSRDSFPEFEKQKGNKSPLRTNGWIDHNNHVEMTKRNILLLKREIISLNNIMNNRLEKSLNGSIDDTENTLSESERRDASADL